MNIPVNAREHFRLTDFRATPGLFSSRHIKSNYSVADANAAIHFVQCKGIKYKVNLQQIRIGNLV